MRETTTIYEKTVLIPTAARRVGSFMRPAKMALTTVQMKPSMLVKTAGMASFVNMRKIVDELGNGASRSNICRS